MTSSKKPTGILAHSKILGVYKKKGKVINTYAEVPISETKPYLHNPESRMTEGNTKLVNIQKSIEGRLQLLLIPPLLAKDGTIIDGHGRIAVCEKMGQETVPCLVFEDIDKALAWLTLNSSDCGKPLNYLEKMSSLLTGFPFDKLPERCQKDYRLACRIFGEEFVKENLLGDDKRGRSMRNSIADVSTLMGPLWNNKISEKFARECFHWLFILKNRERFRNLRNSKATYEPTEQERKLVLNSIKNKENLYRIAGEWVSEYAKSI